MKESNIHFQSKIDAILQALKNSPSQDVEWPDYLDGEMEVHRASQEYIIIFNEVWNTLVEPYVLEFVILCRPVVEPYVLKQIIPYEPGVEPYVPEDMGPLTPDEDKEFSIWEWDDLEDTEDILDLKCSHFIQMIFPI